MLSEDNERETRPEQGCEEETEPGALPVPDPDEKGTRRSEDSFSPYDMLQSICAAVVFGILIFIFIFHVTTVRGSSMNDTLLGGDRLFTSNLFYTPEQGDVVIFRTPYYEEPLIKRVIATGGQTVDIDFLTGDVFVDGALIEEDYIKEPTRISNGFAGPLKVPEGMLFVMGDNRNNSNDSRLPAIGCVDVRAVQGKAYFILVPGKDILGNRDWSRLGSIYR
ncbi:MAG: signal peptidase I [Oscillospiraceae bacterium]|nr:signal peptidase I [Oscillospiraceae bacterium]